ncbi:MAG: ASCH domain-containing protein [Dehalococcoidia bacterium]|nr:ASCH domain-containing protein [Dehalococcoidia bacterium]
MKAITLWQPWASLIAAGIKTAETRSWQPPATLVGQRIAIHAGKEMVLTHDHRVEATLQAEFGDNWPYDLPRGFVVCTAVLTRVWATTDRPARYGVDVYGDYSPGRYVWELDAIDALDDPAPAVGHQRIWEWAA